jgi:hypothetical protein
VARARVSLNIGARDGWTVTPYYCARPGFLGIIEVSIPADLDAALLLSAKPKETRSMPTARKAPLPATKPKAHRSASKKPQPGPTSTAVQEFDVAAHHEEIAQAAYCKWRERAGSPEEDWLNAEIEVRARYMQGRG